MRRWLGLLLIIMLISGTLWVSREKQRPSTSTQPASSPVVTDFYATATLDLQPDELGFATQRYVARLPAPHRLEIARVAINDPDPRFGRLAIGLLIDGGHEDEAIPRLADLVRSGADLTGFFYAWLHAADRDLARRMYVKVSRELLAEQRPLSAEEQSRVDAFLCIDGFGLPHIECSRAEALRRLDTLN